MSTPIKTLLIFLGITALVIVVLLLVHQKAIGPEQKPGLPCGYSWHPCSHQTLPDGGVDYACCPNGSDCGGVYPNCPAGQCCPNGEDPNSFQARPNTPQRKASELP
jgi:hypothetical protein